jgi:5'-nucleotidase
MPLILITNDDGYRSEGIRVLADAFARLGDTTIVAPIEEASAVGHALTLRRPLRLELMSGHVKDAARGAREDVGRGFSAAVYAVDGTPTDCVNIAVTQVFKRLPDLVVSGINKGWNLGDDVTYSGTVAGALEAALLGVPAIAVSLAATRGTYDFSHAAAAAASIAESLLANPLPSRTFLNINLPKGKPKGFRVTVQAKRNHITTVAERHDPKGRPYFWIEEGQDEWHPHDQSDYQAVRDGYVSVTPLQPDLTAHSALSRIEGLLPADVNVR